MWRSMIRICPGSTSEVIHHHWTNPSSSWAWTWVDWRRILGHSCPDTQPGCRLQLQPSCRRELSCRPCGGSWRWRSLPPSLSRSSCRGWICQILKHNHDEFNVARYDPIPEVTRISSSSLVLMKSTAVTHALWSSTVVRNSKLFDASNR